MQQSLKMSQILDRKLCSHIWPKTLWAAFEPLDMLAQDTKLQLMHIQMPSYRDRPDLLLTTPYGLSTSDCDVLHKCFAAMRTLLEEHLVASGALHCHFLPVKDAICR